MSDFVWILSVDKNASFGKSGASSSYIIPKGDMKILPESLAGHRLWILLRGLDDRVFLSVKIKKIERIIKGYNKGDYVISVDLLQSFRLVSKYTEATNYITKGTTSFGLGVCKINALTAREFSQMVIQNVGVKFTKPSPQLFLKVNTKILPRSGQFLAKSSLRLVVSHFNLNKIWAEGTGKKLNAFSNFAHAIIINNVPPKYSTGVVEFLKLFDPLNVLLNHKDKTTKERARTNLYSPKVDIDFTEVDPEKIYAREFVSSGDKFKNLDSALNKTEHAEKTHQEMLKNIAEFLISKGIVPYESGSIDLMYKSKSKLIVCEIKSTTLDNILTQSSKGAFQLTCYIDELVKIYDDTLPQLILKKIGNKEIESYVERVLLRMNISVLYYDSGKSWPNKLPKLLL